MRQMWNLDGARGLSVSISNDFVFKEDGIEDDVPN